MPYDYSTSKNKNPKVDYQQYLHNINEPQGGLWQGTSSQDEESDQDTRHMRDRFREIAQRLRDQS